MATIRKRGNSYQIRVSCGTDINGKKIIESMTWKPEPNMTPKQIEKQLQRQAILFEENVKKGTIKKDNKIKLQEFCTIYLEMQKKKLSPVSYYQYTIILNDYIIPSIGHLKLKDITPMHLQKFIYNLSEEGIRKDGKNGSLSPSSIHRYFTVVQSVFRFAYRMGIIESNPSTTQNLDLPKIIPPHTDVFDEKQIQIMLTSLEKEPIMWKTLIHLALCTGCRCGEIAALQWEDILWKECKIKITKSVYQANGEIGIKLPKTKSSIRTVSVPAYLMALLKQYKAHQSSQILCSSTKNSINDMLFTNTKGYYLSPPIIYQWFTKFLKKNNIPHIKFHALRHTSATLLLANGTNIKTVSSRLGHTNLTTTNRYVHALNDADISAAELLGEKLNTSKKGQKWDKTL